MPSPQAAQVATDDFCPPSEAPKVISGRAPSHTIEDIAQAYLRATKGDLSLALRCAISDALADLMEAERRCNERNRLISHGYVRNALHDAAKTV